MKTYVLYGYDVNMEIISREEFEEEELAYADFWYLTNFEDNYTWEIKEEREGESRLLSRHRR